VRGIVVKHVSLPTPNQIRPHRSPPQVWHKNQWFQFSLIALPLQLHMQQVYHSHQNQMQWLVRDQPKHLYLQGLGLQQCALAHYLLPLALEYLVQPSSKQSKLKKQGYHTIMLPTHHNILGVNVTLQSYFPYLLGYGSCLTRFDRLWR